jgi:hypothetical protein
MTAGDPAAGQPSAVVLGPPGLLLEVVVRLLDEADWTVDLEGDRRSRPPNAVVLVEPMARHWSRAAAIRAGIVVVQDGLTVEEAVGLLLRGADAIASAWGTPESLLEALSIVAVGGSLLEPRVAREVLARWRALARPPGASDPVDPADPPPGADPPQR